MLSRMFSMAAAALRCVLISAHASTVAGSWDGCGLAPPPKNNRTNSSQFFGNAGRRIDHGKRRADGRRRILDARNLLRRFLRHLS